MYQRWKNVFSWRRDLVDTHRWTWIEYRTEFLCPCGVGHGPYWRGTVHGCCPSKCCKQPDFPGRRPRVGDLALDWSGALAVVTKIEEKHCTGLHLTTVTHPILSPWESTRTCVLPITMAEFILLKRNRKALSMPHLHLLPYLVEAWPKKLQYVEPSEVKKIAAWYSTWSGIEGATDGITTQ